MQKLLKLFPLSASALKAPALVAVAPTLLALLVHPTTRWMIVARLVELKSMKAPLERLPGAPTLAWDVSVY